MNHTNLNRLPLTDSKDKDCDCQPTWLSLALAILPAILPVLIDKIADFLMHWLFGEEDAEEEEDEEIKPKKSKGNKQ